MDSSMATKSVKDVIIREEEDTVLTLFCDGPSRNNTSFILKLPKSCYLRIRNAEGYVLIAVYSFIYLFICVLLA